MSKKKKKTVDDKKEIIQENVDEIEADSVVKLDNLGNGMYKLTMDDSSTIELSLDEGEADQLRESIQERLGDVNSPQPSDEESYNEDTSVQETLNERFNRGPLERNLSTNFSNIRVKPHLRGYWPLHNEAGRYMSLGYDYAKPEDIENYEAVISYLNPGQTQTPDGRITYEGHVLMVTTPEIAKRKHDMAYAKRVTADQIRGNLSPNEMRARGLKT
jgi:hypothetical protein